MHTITIKKFNSNSIQCYICANPLSSLYFAASDLGYYICLVMTFFYSSSDLHNLNCSYPLPTDIYNSCASLEILEISLEIFVKVRSLPPVTIFQ